MEQITFINFPTTAAAEVAKNKLRARGIHAHLSSTDASNWHTYKATRTQVVVVNHHPQVGSLKPVVERVLGVTLS